MLDFVRNSFRGLFAFLLWVILIGCAVCGYVFGSLLHEIEAVRSIGAVIGFKFFGVLAGTVVGLVIDIIFGGMTATILHFDEMLTIIYGTLTITARDHSVEEELKKLNARDHSVEEELKKLNASVKKLIKKDAAPSVKKTAKQNIEKKDIQQDADGAKPESSAADG
jgi:hypothetical protein